MYLQLIAVPGELEAQGAESGGDIMTETSNLSEEVSGELTAEGRREMWRRAHHRTDVGDYDAQVSQQVQTHTNASPVCL